MLILVCWEQLGQRPPNACDEPSQAATLGKQSDVEASSGIPPQASEESSPGVDIIFRSVREASTQTERLDGSQEDRCSEAAISDQTVDRPELQSPSCRSPATSLRKLTLQEGIRQLAVRTDALAELPAADFIMDCVSSRVSTLNSILSGDHGVALARCVVSDMLCGARPSASRPTPPESAEGARLSFGADTERTVGMSQPRAHRPPHPAEIRSIRDARGAGVHSALSPSCMALSQGGQQGHPGFGALAVGESQRSWALTERGRSPQVARTDAVTELPTADFILDCASSRFSTFTSMVSIGQLVSAASASDHPGVAVRLPVGTLNAADTNSPARCLSVPT
eukprot:TRINITY_DN62742_c0_g1_i1.p1 TRINITY_DN62742_c0_g1~~TRINITY_DN62742_c0_g1_i1.p1  ORF type:complete len:339 (-),score=21.71 TRINITY_DN62742_c0_g1_i1:75-1091(-)